MKTQTGTVHLPPLWDQENTVGMIDPLKQCNLYVEGRGDCVFGKGHF